MQFGKITYWNQPKGYGFVTVVSKSLVPTEAPSQQQFFFHHSNFTKGEVPVLGAFAVFELGEAFAVGRKAQAVGVRHATAKDLEITNGVTALESVATGVK